MNFCVLFQLMSANEDLPCLQFINANEDWILSSHPNTINSIVFSNLTSQTFSVGPFVFPVAVFVKAVADRK